ncbi:MAG: Hpt domain-containing protein [bacterium]|nr:Hpt domain-containing protein [bacterium]MCP5068612.1 Hpt domain-containing protein [bacterium]
MKPTADGTLDLPVFDRAETLAGLADDLELVAELAELLLADLPGMLAATEQAANEGDAEGLQRAAHTLKGAVSNFHAEPAQAAALRLEQMGRSKDLSEVEPAREALRREIDRLRPEIEKLLQT